MRSQPQIGGRKKSKRMVNALSTVGPGSSAMKWMRKRSIVRPTASTVALMAPAGGMKRPSMGWLSASGVK
jgi:hypothetical protein